MRHDIVQTVEKLLDTTKGQTIKELTVKAGVSPNTVRTALDHLGAVSDGFHPAGWTKVAKTKQASLATKSQPTVSVPLDIDGDWVNRWEKARQRVGSRFATTEIMAESDPKELCSLFLDAAKIFSSIAYELEQIKDKPDWFELLGGQLESDFEEERQVS